MGKRSKNIFLGAFPFLSLLLLWQLAYILHWTPPWLLPSPLETFTTFWNLLINGALFHLVALSAVNAIPAFLLALFASVVLGTLIGTNFVARKIFMPFLAAIYPVPSIAWLPLIILFLGFSRETIWCVIFISCFMKVIYCIIDGVQRINPHWILTAQNLSISKMDTVLHIIIPGTLPSIITGARIGFGSSWRALISAEMLVASFGGLGKFIWTAQWYFSFDKVFAGILVVAIIGLVIEKLFFEKLEKIVFRRWGLLQENI